MPADVSASMTSANTFGWVLDRATSQRRLCVYQSGADSLGLLVEVYGQPSSIVELDAEGVVILRGLLGRGLDVIRDEEE